MKNPEILEAQKAYNYLTEAIPKEEVTNDQLLALTNLRATIALAEMVDQVKQLVIGDIGATMVASGIKPADVHAKIADLRKEVGL